MLFLFSLGAKIFHGYYKQFQVDRISLKKHENQKLIKTNQNTLQKTMISGLRQQKHRSVAPQKKKSINMSSTKQHEKNPHHKQKTVKNKKRILKCVT